MLPETQAKTPNTNTIRVAVPAANPSMPSVRFAPFETAVTIKITNGINTNQAYTDQDSSIQVITWA